MLKHKTLSYVLRPKYYCVVTERVYTAQELDEINETTNEDFKTIKEFESKLGQ